MSRHTHNVAPHHALACRVLLCVSAIVLISLATSDTAHAQSVLGKADSFL